MSFHFIVCFDKKTQKLLVFFFWSQKHCLLLCKTKRYLLYIWFMVSLGQSVIQPEVSKINLYLVLSYLNMNVMNSSLFVCSLIEASFFFLLSEWKMEFFMTSSSFVQTICKWNFFRLRVEVQGKSSYVSERKTDLNKIKVYHESKKKEGLRKIWIFTNVLEDLLFYFSTVF